MSFSVAWLQRGCDTCGFTFAQKPYSAPAPLPEALGPLVGEGELHDRLDGLKPYFQGLPAAAVRRMVLGGLAVDAGDKEGEFVGASAIVRPST